MSHVPQSFCLDACSSVFKIKDKLKEAAKPVDVSAECRAAIQINMPATQQLFNLNQSPMQLSSGCVAPSP